MPMLPKRTKFRKQQRGSLRGNATRGNYVAFGDFGLQTLEAHWLTARQIEAGRIAAQHFLRRQGKIYIRVFPDKPVCKKPLETRMGKGKGAPDHYVAVIKPGLMLYEIDGVDPDVAKEACRLAAHKLPIKTRFVTRGIL